MKVSVVNLGCKVNRVESDTIAMAYKARGSELVSSEEADVIVVNTCTVTGEAEKKTRKTIRKLLRTNETADVLVTGCAAEISAEELLALDDRIFIVDKLELIGKETQALRVGEEFPTRVGVKVQDGCNHSCTYCIVHVARGKAWSRPKDEIVEEVVLLAQAGVKEVVLSGIDLGSYFYEGQRLTNLMEALLEATKEYEIRFRIGSIEPCSISQGFIDLMAASDGRICRHLHLPLQAGSSKVLKEMNRPYDREGFLKVCQEMKALMPDISLSTDIIVGFPGESEEEFQETLTLAEEVGFTKIHVFRYSIRKGTPAAARKDQIASEVKEDRARRLQTLADSLRKKYALEHLGKEERVVIEQQRLGTTESYYKIKVSEDLPISSSVILRLTDFDEFGILKS